MLAASWSVLIALILAGATLMLPTSSLTTDLGQLLGACLNRLRAAYSSPGDAALAFPGQAVSVGLIARVLWVASRLAATARTERRRHRLLIRLAGSPLPDGDAVVLDSPGAVAYCVSGRRPAVVVTRGATDLLSAQQLDAVLAHEEAHLAARHHRWSSAAAIAARSLPFIPLLRQTPARVAALLEMDADELAAHRHDRRILASALVAVGTAGATTASSGRHRGAGAGAGAGAASEAAARVRRLLRPPQQLPRRRRTLARAGVVAVTTGPVLLAAMPGLLALR